MFNASRLVLVSTVLAGMLLASTHARAGDAPAPPAKPATLEAQIEYLEGALSEAFRTEDWAMLDLVVQGLKKVQQTADTREMLFLRAERDAALEGPGGGSSFDTRARIETWGLAARVQLGDTKALEKLREFAKPLEEAKPLAGARMDWRRMYLPPARQAQALLCLALLKEPGIPERVQARLRSSPGPSAGTSSLRPVVLAALVADPDGGWKMLADFCAAKEDPKVQPTQVSVLQELGAIQTMLSDENKSKQNPNSLIVQLKPKLPEQAAKEITKTYTAMVNAVPADVKDIGNISRLVQAGSNISLDADARAALEALKGKVTGTNARWVNQMVDHLLKKPDSGAAPPPPGPGPGPGPTPGSGTVKPPPPPGGF